MTALSGLLKNAAEPKPVVITSATSGGGGEDRFTMDVYASSETPKNHRKEVTLNELKKELETGAFIDVFLILEQETTALISAFGTSHQNFNQDINRVHPAHSVLVKALLKNPNILAHSLEGDFGAPEGVKITTHDPELQKAAQQLLAVCKKNKITAHNWMTKIINNPESISSQDVEHIKPIMPAILSLMRKQLSTVMLEELKFSGNEERVKKIDEEIERIFSAKTKADEPGLFADKVKSTPPTSPERS